MIIIVILKRMKSFIIRVPTDPLKELMLQQEELHTEIHERLMVHHQHTLVDYVDEEKRERRLAVLRDSAKQIHEMHTTESLSTQILHIAAQEIINRKPSQITCEYKGHLFIIPIRYKN